jgi:hypothetical protein
VEKDHVTIKLEFHIQDLATFSKLIPDDIFKEPIFHGRLNILPNDIPSALITLQQRTEGDFFEVVALIRDGEVISENKEDVMATLIRAEE